VGVKEREDLGKNVPTQRTAGATADPKGPSIEVADIKRALAAKDDQATKAIVVATHG